MRKFYNHKLFLKQKGVVGMSKRNILLHSILVLLLLITGCERSTEQNGEVLLEEQVSVTVILDEVPTIEVLTSLEEAGLTIESVEGKMIIGTVDESKLEELKIEEVVSVKEKKDYHETFVWTPEREQEIVEQHLKARNQTGPSIMSLLEENLKNKEFAPMYIRYRLEYFDNDTCFDSVMSKVNENDILIEVYGRTGITGEINKEGLEILKEIPCILKVGWRSFDIPRYKELEDGTEVRLISVKVTPRDTILKSELESLQGQGLQVSYDGKILFGEITEEQLNELKANPALEEVIVR